MMERRQALKTNGSKVPKLIEEAGMRSFIEVCKTISAEDVLHGGLINGL